MSGPTEDTAAADALLLFTEDIQGAVQEITSYHGSRVTQILSTNILIAHFPPGFDTQKLQKSGIINADVPQVTLDKQSQLMLEALNASQSQKKARGADPAEGLKWDTPGHEPPGKDDPTSTSASSSKASQSKRKASGADPTEGLKWDTPGHEPPGKDDPTSTSTSSDITSTSLALATCQSTGALAPTSLRMTGTIAVGLVIVSGSPVDLQFTNDEQNKVIDKVTAALDFLALEEPAASIMFHQTVRTVTVSKNELVPKTGMSETPSAVMFNGKLFCFHQGYGQSEDLWYNEFDGTDWKGDTKVPNTGMTKWPSAVVYHKKIYCFHCSSTPDGGDRIWYNVFDGDHWEGDKQVPDTGISEGPSCVIFQGKLYCFHQGCKDNHELWYNVFDGSTWEGDRRISTSYITSGPSAVVFDSKLYYFYRGDDGNSGLWYNRFDGSKWEGDHKVAGTILSASPSCTVHQGKLHCFHQGGANNGQLWCNILDRNDWKGDIHVADVSMSQGPSTVIGFDGQLYCFYQGPMNNSQLLYRTFDEVSFEAIWWDPVVN